MHSITISIEKLKQMIDLAEWRSVHGSMKPYLKISIKELLKGKPFLTFEQPCEYAECFSDYYEYYNEETEGKFKLIKKAGNTMNFYKKYIETTEFPGKTHLLVTVFYDKNSHKRGYYLDVIPVRKHDGMWSLDAYISAKMLLKETKRFSQKQFEEAVELSESKTEDMIQQLRVLQEKQKSLLQ